MPKEIIKVMTISEIRKMGDVVRLWNGTQYWVCHGHAIHTASMQAVSLDHLYRSIRNVKNKKKEIIAKRFNPDAKLYCTEHAYPVIQKHRAFRRVTV